MKIVILLRHRTRDYTLRQLNVLNIRAYTTHIGARFIDATFLDVPILKQCTSLLRALFKPKGWVMWKGGGFFDLPPSHSVPESYQAIFESSNFLFLTGWHYENPKGLVQYRTRLLPIALKSFDIGVYIRQKPHDYFPQGEFLVPPERMEKIIDEYLLEHHLQKANTKCILVSDLPLPDTLLPNCERVITDDVSKVVAALSTSKTVIGANLALCKLAAYTANAPHIVATNQPVDWEYYRGKDVYFDNTYATLTLGLRDID